jgi:hypothetical protein
MRPWTLGLGGGALILLPARGYESRFFRSTFLPNRDSLTTLTNFIPPGGTVPFQGNYWFCPVPITLKTKKKPLSLIQTLIISMFFLNFLVLAFFAISLAEANLFVRYHPILAGEMREIICVYCRLSTPRQAGHVMAARSVPSNGWMMEKDLCFLPSVLLVSDFILENRFVGTF